MKNNIERAQCILIEIFLESASQKFVLCFTLAKSHVYVPPAIVMFESEKPSLHGYATLPPNFRSRSIHIELVKSSTTKVAYFLPSARLL